MSALPSYSNLPTTVTGLLSQYIPLNSNISRNTLFDNNIAKNQVYSWLTNTLKINPDELKQGIPDSQIGFLSTLKQTDNGNQFFDVRKFQELIGQGLNYKPIINFLINTYIQTPDLLSCFLLPSSSCCERKHMILNMILNNVREIDFKIDPDDRPSGSIAGFRVLNKEMISCFFDDEKVIEIMGLDRTQIPLLKCGFALAQTTHMLIMIYLKKFNLVGEKGIWKVDERLEKYFGVEGNNTIAKLLDKIKEDLNSGRNIQPGKQKNLELYSKENKLTLPNATLIAMKNVQFLFDNSLNNLFNSYVKNFKQFEAFPDIPAAKTPNMVTMAKYFRPVIAQMYDELEYMFSYIQSLRTNSDYNPDEDEELDLGTKSTLGSRTTARGRRV